MSARSCHGLHPFQPARCPDCRAIVPKGPAKEKAPAAQPAPVPSRPARVKERIASLMVLPPCVHRGAETGEQARCDTCGGKDKTTPVMLCELHGECTERAASVATEDARIRRRFQACRGCRDLCPPQSATWSMLLTGGIGDVFAVEGLLTPEERESLGTIYYACPSAEEIVRLWQALEGRHPYPRLRHHIVLPTGQTTHYTIDTVRQKVASLPDDVKDFSILGVFSQRRTYTGSTWLTRKLADLAPTPGPYAVIVPGSDWGQTPGREFDAADWKACTGTLERQGLSGLVLRKTPHPLPRHPWLVDLQGKTSILESVEALKGADGYLGVDSALSVLAAKLFPASRLTIKSVRDHLYQNQRVYYAPRTEFAFVGRQLRVPSWS